MRFSNQVKQSVLTSNRKGDCRHKIPCETYKDREMNILEKKQALKLQATLVPNYDPPTHRGEV